MLALFSKSWKSTQSGSTHLDSRLFPQCRPCFSSQVAHVPNNFYSTPAGQNPDKATLHKFKRVLALRQEFERCEGVDILHHRFRYARKLIREGITYENLVTKQLKAIELDIAISDFVSEMCKTERRKREKDWETDAPPWLQRVFREHSDRLVIYGELVEIVSHFEALLEADAAQQRPLLSSQERGTVEDVLKKYLKSQRWSGRRRLALCLAVASLMGWGYYWFYKWVWGLHERTWPGRERDFSELHTWDDDVE